MVGKNINNYKIVEALNSLGCLGWERTYELFKARTCRKIKRKYGKVGKEHMDCLK